MTPDEKANWNSYACVTRCLLNFAESQGNVITPDDFISRFSARCSQWSTHFGLLTIQEFVMFAFELELASRCQYFPDVNTFSQSLPSCNFKAVLILTHRALNPADEWYVVHHSRRLLDVQGDSFHLFHPNPDGQAFRVVETLTRLQEQCAEF